MAVYTIQAPDGRKIKIEAGDEATALRGAQEWTAANPKAVSLQGKVAAQGSTGEVSSNVQGLDAQGGYDFALNRVRERQFPKTTDEKWAGAAKEFYAPYDAGKLFNAGLTFGFNDEAAGAGQALGSAMRGNDLGNAYADFSELERARQKLGAEQSGPLGIAAEMGGAMMAGRPDMAAAKVAGFIPSLLESAKGSAVGGGLYGFGSTDGNIHDRLTGAGMGALGSTAIGVAVPAAVAGGKRIISPGRAPQAKVDAANILKNEGVELTAGQATGNKKLQYREAELGGATAENFMERQAEQFTAAALKRAGLNAGRATHDVIESGFSGIGQQFDDMASRNHIQPDQRLATDLQRAWKRFEGVTNPGTRPKVIERYIADIYAKGGKGPVSGEWYKSRRSELGKLTTHENADLAEAARDMMSALDDAMERTIKATNPADLGGWREARRLYKNMLVIRDAATRAGAASAEGIITPQALRSAAIRQNKNAFARGRNEFVDLADAGVSAMTPLPNSGTPGRLGAKMLLPAGAATGATVGGIVGGPVGAGIGAVAGAAVPWSIGKAIMSGPGRAYLTNQLASKPVGGLAALLGSGAGRGVQPLLPRN